MAENVGRLIIVELARLDIFVVQRAVLILEVNDIRDMLIRIILTADFFKQLIVRNIEGFNLYSRILFHECIRNLGNTRGDRVNRHFALLLCQFVKFFIRIVGIKNA